MKEFHSQTFNYVQVKHSYTLSNRVLILLQTNG